MNSSFKDIADQMGCQLRELPYHILLAIFITRIFLLHFTMLKFTLRIRGLMHLFANQSEHACPSIFRFTVVFGCL
jgi:hypothetical protein